MAAADFTKKEIADALASVERGDGLPENTIFDPWQETRGGQILRRMTPEEIKAHGGKAKAATDKEE